VRSALELPQPIWVLQRGNNGWRFAQSLQPDPAHFTLVGDRQHDFDRAILTLYSPG
jgi:hypothetical protein